MGVALDVGGMTATWWSAEKGCEADVGLSAPRRWNLSAPPTVQG